MQRNKDDLLVRKRYLEDLVEKVERSLEKAPEGSLRICRKEGGPDWYYHRKNTSDKNGVYIPQDNRNLAVKLAQKDYDRKVKKLAQQELKFINDYLNKYPEWMVEDVYSALTEERQEMVNPYCVSDELYIKKWEDISYKGKDFPADFPEMYTDRGERVRSKSEVIIANLLYHSGIPYRYEYPLKLRGYGTVYPDFTILHTGTRKDIYWEHFGMMDDPEYAQRAVQKVKYYNMNDIFAGDRLIITMETKEMPLHAKQVKSAIEHYLTDNTL